MILIGSKALKHWFSDFNREPSDTDYLCTKEEIPKKKEYKTEYLFIPPLLKYIDYKNDTYLEKNLLFTLKISHLFWDFKWEKHIFDVTFMKSKGCVLNKPLFNELYEFWNIKHGENKRSNLELSKEEFFNNALKKYDHDYLHTLINPIPIFTKILKEGKDVEVDESKFNQLPFEDKLELVREEIYVMAYERLAGRDFRTAYSWMLKKFIMNHAPLWEALFIIENYQYLYKPIYNYKIKLDYELPRN